MGHMIGYNYFHSNLLLKLDQVTELGQLFSLIKVF